MQCVVVAIALTSPAFSRITRWFLAALTPVPIASAICFELRPPACF